MPYWNVGGKLLFSPTDPTPNSNGVPLDANGNQIGNGELKVSVDAQKQIDDAAIANATKPKRPDFASIVDPATGQLKSNYQIMPFAQEELSKINLNTDGLQQIRDMTKAPGQSAWAKLMNQSQGLEEAGQRDVAQKTGSQAAATAFDTLAMRGGVSGGERERIAYGANNDTANALQGVSRQGQMDRAKIATQDETNRLDLLKGLPGMETQALDPQFKKATLLGNAKTIDLGNLVNDTRDKNQYELGSYTEDAKNWAANKQAEAQSASSGGK